MERVLLITDVPLCNNYTGGIMTTKLCNVLLGEKVELYAFIPWDRTLNPNWDENIINDITMETFIRPSEMFNNMDNITKYKKSISRLNQELYRFVIENQITKVWAICQGKLICDLVNKLYKKIKIDYYVQIWDPIEWWIKEHHFSPRLEKETMNAFSILLKNCRRSITTSKNMSKYYNNRYNVLCSEVMPPIEKKIFSNIEQNEDNTYKIALTGQIYAKREMDALFTALDKLEWRIDGKKVFFYHFGMWNPNYIDMVKHNKYKSRIKIMGNYSQDLLLYEISKMDLLVCPYFFGQDNIERMVSSISFPSKLITYLTVNVPALLIAPDYSSPYQFCKFYDCAYTITSLDIHGVTEFLQKQINPKHTNKIIRNSEVAYYENFEITRISDNFLNALDVKHKKIKKLSILEVNNVDLPGRRFNGYDLIDYINNNTMHSGKQIVTYKSSNNKNVIKYYDSSDIVYEWNLIKKETDYLAVHNNLSLTSSILLNNSFFRQCDLVHYHLIHNTKLSLDSFANIVSMHPSVITIHDPWFFTGRCVYPQECNRWKNGCNNCPYIDNLFPLKTDNCNSLWNLKKKVFSKIDADIIVTTPFMKKMIKESPLTKNFKHVHVVPFGIDLTKFLPDDQIHDSRSALNIPQNDFVVFFRSQMAMKGTEYIVEALEMLETNESITVLSCDEVGNLESLKQKYNVIELGHIGNEEMLKAYNACDLFLMPSRGESFGLMAIEAMAASRPIVVFDNSALPYVTYAPECGVLVNNKDSIDLMNKIQWLIDNPSEREKRGKLGRRLAEEHYDLDVYNKRILEIYEAAYERQKNKKVILHHNTKLNMANKSVHLLANVLSEIWEEIAPNERKPYYLPQTYEVVHKPLKIDYSDDEVQSLIRMFNNSYFEVYNKNKKEKLVKPKIAQKQHLFRYKNTVSKIIRKVKKVSFLYVILRTLYRIIRRFYYFCRKIRLHFYFKSNRYKINLLNERINCLDKAFLTELKRTDVMYGEIHNLQNNLYCDKERVKGEE